MSANPLSLCMRDVPRSSPCASRIRFASDVFRKSEVSRRGEPTSRTAEHVCTGRSCTSAKPLALCMRDVFRSSPCASRIRFAAVENL